MTFTIKQETRGGRYVGIEQDKAGLYIVTLAVEHSNGLYRALKRYTSHNRKNALQTYNRYRREL